VAVINKSVPFVFFVGQCGDADVQLSAKHHCVGLASLDPEDCPINIKLSIGATVAGLTLVSARVQ
jgi:hypothetical protein